MKTESKRMQAREEIRRLNAELENRVSERTRELAAANEELRREIAERKQVEEALRRSEDRIRLIIDTIPTMAWTVRPDGTVDFLNQRWMDYSGLSLGQYVADPMSPIHPDDVPKVLEQWRASMALGEPYEDEIRLRRADGQYRWFLVRNAPLRDQLGNVIEWYGVSTDISESKKAEEALDERLRFETLVTELSAAFANLSTNEVDCEIDKWLKTLVEFLGVDRASFLQFGADSNAFYRSHSYTVPGIEPLPPPPVAMKEQFPWITDQLRRGVTVKWPRIPDDMPVQAVNEREYAARLGVKSGLNIPVLLGGSVICAITFTSVVTYSDWPDPTVARLRLVGEIFAGAVERKRAEAVLHAKEQEFRAIVENAPDQILRYDREFRRTYVNPAVAKAYGLPAEALIGKPIGSVINDAGLKVSGDELARVRQRIADVFDTGQSYEYEMTWPMSTGRRHLSVRLFPELDLHGAVVNVLGISRDITERKVAEEELKKEKEILGKIFDNIPVMISFVGDDGGVKLVNPEWERTMGWTLKELEEHNVDLIAEAFPDLSYRQEVVDFVAASAGEWVDLKIKVRDGRVIDAACAVVHLSDGTRIGIARDITERKRADDSLREALLEINRLKDQLYKENIALREEIVNASMFEEIVGTSPALQKVLLLVAKVAPTDSTVLITGETGTGKELIARAIHNGSNRAERVFVSVHCAAIPPSLIASELFGHEKGAFTDAVQQRLGRFELAEGGTIFLDEIGELPAETQVALLRVLQEREFERIGGSKTIRTNVRVIASTNRDLQAAINAGVFRSDLFYRLNVFPIEMPSLRERREDIPLLVEYFIQRYGSQMGKKITRIDKKTLDMLALSEWPGNIRELQNVIERSVILNETETFTIDKSWLTHQGQPQMGKALVDNLVIREKEMIEAALAQSRGQVSGPLGAAAKLGIPPSTLDSKIRALNINKHRFKTS